MKTKGALAFRFLEQLHTFAGNMNNLCVELRAIRWFVLAAIISNNDLDIEIFFLGNSFYLGQAQTKCLPRSSIITTEISGLLEEEFSVVMV